MSFRLFLLLASTLSVASGDRLVLRNGKVVEGTFVGGDARSIRMAVGEKVETFSVSDVATLEFAPAAAAQPAEPKPEFSQAAAPAQAQPAEERKGYLGWEESAAGVTASVEIPAGTEVTVRLTQDVDSGATWRAFAAVVDAPVVVNGRTLIPRDTEALVMVTENRTLLLDTIRLQDRSHMVASDEVPVQGASPAAEKRAESSPGVIGGVEALTAIAAAMYGKEQTPAAKPAAVAAGAEGRVARDTRLTFRLKDPIRP